MNEKEILKDVLLELVSARCDVPSRTLALALQQKPNEYRISYQESKEDWPVNVTTGQAEGADKPNALLRELAPAVEEELGRRCLAVATAADYNG